MSAHRGRSAATKVATTPCTPSSAPSRTSTTSSPPQRIWAWKWPSIWRCSVPPTIPWAQDHRQWFTELPDGTIAYAENPPKKYQDIYPLNFDNDPAGLYTEVLRVVRYWVDHGVKIFRVDNPHTKPPNFWAWLIGRGQEHRPRCAVPRRGVHPSGPALRPGQAGLHPVLQLFHLAHRQVGAHRVRPSRSPSTPTRPGPTCSSTPPTSCTRACSTAARACSRSARRWRPH